MGKNSTKIKNNDDIIERNKIIIIGDINIGKTSIISRFIHKNPNGNFIFNKTYEINGKIINFEIWDTSGQEKYRSVPSIFYKNSKIIIMCYDITSSSSFENLKDFWYSKIKENNKNNPSK